MRVDRRTATSDASRMQSHRGFGSRVQNALGKLTPKSWGIGPGHGQAAAGHAGSSKGSDSKRRSRNSTDLELSTGLSTSSIGTEAGAASDNVGPSNGPADISRPPTGSISHISSTGSLGAAANDTNSITSGGSLAGRSLGTPAAAASAVADDLCSLATQAGSTAHSFTSLASMMTTHGDASSDGGVSLIPAVPAAAAASSDSRAMGLSTSPTAAGSSNFSLLSAYRSSDAGGDAMSVSTLPLISETGYDDERGRFDERLLDVQTLAEEQEQDEGLKQHEVTEQEGRREGYNASEGALESSSDHTQSNKPLRISSSHGSYTSLASNTSELSGSGLVAAAAAAAAAVARMPSPAHTRMSHSQRSSSRHSFQQQLSQQQLLQDLEESQEEGNIPAGLPVPFSTRRRPDNDDMCSYATQAGSSVHSLSSVMSHLENTQSQRPHWSSDGNVLPATAPSSSQSFSSLQQQQHSRSRRLSAETPGHTAAASPAQFSGSLQSAAASPVTADFDSPGPSSPSAGRLVGGQSPEAAQHGLHRKNSLRGALRAVSRWGSGISQRLQRSSSGGGPPLHHHHQQQQQPQGQLMHHVSLPSGVVAGGSREHELTSMQHASR